jgi:hypothetical protein
LNSTYGAYWEVQGRYFLKDLPKEVAAKLLVAESWFSWTKSMISDLNQLIRDYGLNAVK